MNSDFVAVRSHIWIARAGVAFSQPAPGTVGQESKPHSEDSAWFSPGKIENFQINRSSDLIEIFVPAPGRLVRHKVIDIKKVLDIQFTGLELGPLAMELGLDSTPLSTSSTQFNPGSGGEKEFWLKAQSYNHRDQQILAADLWGHLRLTGGLNLGSDELVKPEYELKVCFSTLNTALI